MKFQGVFETDLTILFARIHFGEKDGEDFAQISFTHLGDMNNEVKSVSIADDALELVVDINGFDMNISIWKSGDEWVGKVNLDAADVHADIKLDYISGDPGFMEHHCIVPEIHVQRLKAHHVYEYEACGTVFQYELNNPRVLEYIKAKGIDVENHHDFSTICQLMKKTAELIHHDGVNYCHDRDNRGTIAQIEHAMKQNGYTNCRGVAIIMHGVLRAYGFKANLVECWPDQSDANDIHVVCEVYAPDLDKTVLLDPSNNLVYYQNGVPINLFELRCAVVKDEIDTLSANADASHNGEAVDLIGMIAYMSKNMMFLTKSIVSDESHELLDENTICLSSKNVKDERFANVKIYTCNVDRFYQQF